MTCNAGFKFTCRSETVVAKRNFYKRPVHRVEHSRTVLSVATENDAALRVYAFRLLDSFGHLPMTHNAFAMHPLAFHA